MRFYLVDDDINTVHMLENLIEDFALGSVVGKASEPQTALKEMHYKEVDICIVDYLMPFLDGASLVKNVKRKMPEIDFIMVSQVDDSNMVGEAYTNGIEFFLHKPLNTIEFEKVVQHVVNKRKMKQKILKIKNFLGDNNTLKPTINSIERSFQEIFIELGINSEKGTKDLLAICSALYRRGHYQREWYDELLAGMSDSPKTVTQRMRRALAKACNHLAQLGLDDYNNETFSRYAYVLFDAKCIKDEMNAIKNGSKTGGKINLIHFIDSCVMEVKRRYEDD